MVSIVKGPGGSAAGEPDAGWIGSGEVALGRWHLPWKLLLRMFRPPQGQRIRPTSTGTVLFLICMGVGAAAFNTGHNILYLTLTVLLTSLVISGVLSWLNFSGVRCRLEADAEGRVGQPSEVLLRVRNENRRLPIFALTFDLRLGRHPTSTRLALEGSLAGGSQTVLPWQFVPSRRGIETVELEQMQSGFPFGFLRKSILCHHRRELVVWPGRVPYDFRFEGLDRREIMGSAVRRRAGGSELLRLRDYVPGDSIRQIHWKATARSRHLVVRETGEEAGTRYWLSFDTHHGRWPRPEQFELAVSFVATLAEDLFHTDRLAGLILGKQSLPVRELTDLHHLLDALAECEPGVGVSEPLGTRGSVLNFIPVGEQRVGCYLNGYGIGQA